MPDISMCMNKECPLREGCYRATAEPDEYWQTYSSFEYISAEEKCDHYWPTKEE